jgi:threonine/homoserine/homoserine lactone efflux protein
VAEAIGDVLPLAVAVAVSPIPIIAVVLILASVRARVNGPAFVVGCVLGLAAIGAIVLLAAGGADASEDGEPATWVSVLKLVLGALLLLVAVRQWRSRPRAGEHPARPGWMDAIDAFTPVKSFAFGVLAAVNPKNLVLAVAAAAAIAQTGIPGDEQAIAYAVFTVIGIVGVAAPVAIFFALGERSREPLDRLGDWMGQNNAVIMAVILLVIGAKLLGDGIAGL